MGEEGWVRVQLPGACSGCPEAGLRFSRPPTQSSSLPGKGIPALCPPLLTGALTFPTRGLSSVSTAGGAGLSPSHRSQLLLIHSLLQKHLAPRHLPAHVPLPAPPHLQLTFCTMVLVTSRLGLSGKGTTMS